MAYFDKHFTIEQARAMIPDLRRRFVDIHALIESIRQAQERAGAQMTIARGNGKGPVVSGAGAEIEKVHAMIEAIVKLGVQIKDLQRGLIDFPHYLDGDPEHEVFLCFELSEETINYWHEIEAGFAGRTAL